MQHVFRFLIFISLIAIVPHAAVANGKPLTVFAAASTQQAVEKIAEACPAMISRQCRSVFAASSTLARQIAGGAPADVYISANEKWMRYLTDNGYVDVDTVSALASNQLVVIAPSDKGVLPGNTDDLIEWLKRDRIAIGDPAHVPAGIYAEQALRSLGAWDGLQARTLRMPNVRSALAVVARAEAGAGIVYTTDALISENVKPVFMLAPDMHDPILYYIGGVKGSNHPDVLKLVKLFMSEAGKAAFISAGFAMVGQ